MIRSVAVYATTSASRRERAAFVELSARSDAKGLAQLGGHLAALVATGSLVWATRGSLWLWPAMALHGIVLVFLFAPLHEAIHRTAFRSRRLNDLVAWIGGAVLILPPGYFRAFHFAHHRHTQDPVRDPELTVPKPRTRLEYLWQVSGVPYWRERIATTLRHARGRVEDPVIVTRQRPAITREARMLLAIYGLAAALAVMTQSDALLYLWLGPAVLGQPFLRLYLMAEHTGCPLVASMLENSRTTRTLAPIRRLAWNMPYHAEHHAYPALPFHALPAAHALLTDRIRVQADGYLAVHREIVAGLGAGLGAALEADRRSTRPLSRNARRSSGRAASPDRARDA